MNTKGNNLFRYLFGLLFGLLAGFYFCYFFNFKQTIKHIDIITDTVYIEKQTNVDAFIEALAWVESRWDDKAESGKQARGYLQITPIFVDEINRLGGNYTYDDAWDREKSIEMFKIIQQHYCPEPDMHYLLKLWNPRAALSYHTAVETKYKELCKTK